MSISAFVSSIKTVVSTSLGQAYTELGYANDVAKNTFKGNDKRYAVLPKGANEVSGILGHVTLEQDFEIILTDGYMNTAMSDGQAQAKAIALQDLAIEVYNDLVKTKAGSPSICLSIRELSLSEPQFIEKDHVIVQSMTVKIKYRNQI